MRLGKFVMYIFEDDVTVLPKQSGWFDDVDPETGELIKLRQSTTYKEDWLGLRELDEKGRLVFETTPGEHMRLSDGAVLKAFKKYFAPPGQGVTPEEEL